MNIITIQIQLERLDGEDANTPLGVAHSIVDDARGALEKYGYVRADVYLNNEQAERL